MAIFTTGINGPIRGRVGRVVGVLREGKYYLRAAPRWRTRQVTEDELQNRERFRVATKWLRPLCPFIRQSFADADTTSSRSFLAAKSYLLKNAMEKTETGFAVNPALMKISRGTLPLPEQITITRDAKNKAILHWDSHPPSRESRLLGATEYDQAMFLLYDPKMPQTSWRLAGSFRKDGVDSIHLTTHNVYHCWFAFVAEDRSRKSESVYLGAI